MKMLYTANGRYIRCCTEEGTRPVIIVCEKEYEVDVQEFMLWSILNWRILREEEISSIYEKMASSSNVTIHRSWQDCVQRLLVRGLLVVGTGDTEYDAIGASQFGIRCIGVSYGFGKKEQLEQAGAYCVCDSVTEVVEVLHHM